MRTSYLEAAARRRPAAAAAAAQHAPADLGLFKIVVGLVQPLHLAQLLTRALARATDVATIDQFTVEVSLVVSDPIHRRHTRVLEAAIPTRYHLLNDFSTDRHGYVTAAAL